MTNHHQQHQQGKDQQVLFSMDKSSHKNPNNNIPLLPSPPLSSSSSSSSQDFETSNHHHNIIHGANETHEKEWILTKNENYDQDVKKPGDENPDQQLNTSHTLKNGLVANSQVSCSPIVVGEEYKTTPLPPPPPSPQEVTMVEESGRDRLKRHRENMAGQVWIPDIWGHEDLLKDWIDCTVFDSSLGNKTIMSARAALVKEGRSTLRIHNQC